MRLAWSRASLRRTLLLALASGLLLASGLGLWSAWDTARDAANAAYDRSLAGAIKAIDANISTASGGLGVELPYALLEFFQLTASGPVFFRVATEDGLVEIGNTDLPPPETGLVDGQPRFRDASYLGEPVRLGSYARRLDPPPSGHAGGTRVVIQVAETLTSRQHFTRALLLEAGARNALLVALALALMALATGWALRPLARLSQEVRQRAPDDLTPIPVARVPTEVRPLVEAMNHHMARHQQASAAQRRFVDDASHQLRTPLATLTTQVDYALRDSAPGPARETLQAIHHQLGHATRQVNQMLALARADATELQPQPVELVALARELTRDAWPQARAAGIDLGFEAPETPLPTMGHAALLREALGNLLHNALRYTPAGGHVTVQLAREGDSARLSVLDDGPGLAPDELGRVGERFFRGRHARPGGTGLGLAIARAVAQRHHGTLELQPRPGGRGLTASLRLPRGPSGPEKDGKPRVFPDQSDPV
ncbi:MAG TPA: sensor histidine kinase N-terminal domain-containing protein [Ottowia sp.]|uniref:sensor histidine kinase n=1 Tax=Ottowia sp. TaxID=1898956 RepID=UPI002BA1FABC|nr:sensor histidine kinase N-terminal domain-containing protein [Ottowia sp.]HMN22587.1 sensor histidine kinase N-terminal domain-containing protein [Ottowia sp.]